jgi:5-methylthioadenosine/S-adenosylhomocysteine deaminase
MYFNLEQLIAANYNYHVNLYLCKGIMDLKDGVKSFAESMDLFKKINKDNYLFGIQGLYTSSPKYFHKNVEYAIKNNFRLHMHFCEEPNESKLIKKQHNVQHCIQPLEKHLSKFRNQIILAHCVVLDEYDHNVIKKYRNIINIAHCPISNAMLRCGVCDVIKFLQNGVNVCIATDGQGSCNSLSMLVNMRNMYFTQNIRDNKFMENVTAYEILKMATVNPAKALGISKIRGSLDIGMSADLLIFNFKNIRMFPIHDLLTDLVFNANEGDIDYVIVNGQIIVNERKIIYDERKLIISQIHKIKHILFKKD